jgi:hypothetical protein
VTSVATSFAVDHFSNDAASRVALSADLPDNVRFSMGVTSGPLDARPGEHGRGHQAEEDERQECGDGGVPTLNHQRARRRQSKSYPIGTATIGKVARRVPLLVD